MLQEYTRWFNSPSVLLNNNKQPFEIQPISHHVHSNLTQYDTFSMITTCKGYWDTGLILICSEAMFFGIWTGKGCNSFLTLLKWYLTNNCMISSHWLPWQPIAYGFLESTSCSMPFLHVLLPVLSLDYGQCLHCCQVQQVKSWHPWTGMKTVFFLSCSWASLSYRPQDLPCESK